MKWLMIGMVAPSIAFRIQSLLLSIEARDLVVSLVVSDFTLDVIAYIFISLYTVNLNRMTLRKSIPTNLMKISFVPSQKSLSSLKRK